VPDHADAVEHDAPVLQARRKRSERHVAVLVDVGHEDGPGVEEHHSRPHPVVPGKPDRGALVIGAVGHDEVGHQQPQQPDAGILAPGERPVDAPGQVGAVGRRRRSLDLAGARANEVTGHHRCPLRDPTPVPAQTGREQGHDHHGDRGRPHRTAHGEQHECHRDAHLQQDHVGQRRQPE